MRTLSTRRPAPPSAATTNHEHQQAVDRLRASYDAVPAGARVRLAKPTSNLFRPRTPAGPGLDVSGLDGVLSVDPVRRTADVQGMCTYEDLVAATLPYGLMPLVVPQLRTITLGGAVTGLGIESTSLWHGLPHESVLEMDVLTGTGEVVTASPDGPDAELFAAFPNSYGSLGYATRLRIELMPIDPVVGLRHVRFTDRTSLAEAIAALAEHPEWEGRRVDAVDGVVFGPDEAYLTLATWGAGAGTPASDYTGQQVYFRSIQERTTDVLTAHDYLWRWDTDWFWCSGAFGAQNPAVRRVWPRRYRRSDVYHRLVGLDTRFGIADRLDRRAGRLRRERVVQDVEVTVDRLPGFLDWFDDHVGMSPIWLCPLRLRSPQGWPTYPLEPGATYVNVGFWGTVHVGEHAPEAPVNRAIEDELQRIGGHKSLYSEAFYDEGTFDALYGGPALAAAKDRYDPQHRFSTLYEKAVGRR